KAGIFFIRRIEETSREDFTRTLAVNLTGPFLVARAFVPHLVKRGAGHLVTIGSVSDHVAYSGSTAYAASKYGLRGMHEVLRQDLARTGVRTTLVSPGPVDTPIWDAVDPDSKPGFTKRSAMMQAGDVAAAVLYAVTQPLRVDVTEIRLMPTVYTARGQMSHVTRCTLRALLALASRLAAQALPPLPGTTGLGVPVLADPRA